MRKAISKKRLRTDSALHSKTHCRSYREAVLVMNMGKKKLLMTFLPLVDCSSFFFTEEPSSQQPRLFFFLVGGCCNLDLLPSPCKVQMLTRSSERRERGGCGEKKRAPEDTLLSFIPSSSLIARHRMGGGGAGYVRPKLSKQSF